MGATETKETQQLPGAAGTMRRRRWFRWVRRLSTAMVVLLGGLLLGLFFWGPTVLRPVLVKALAGVGLRDPQLAVEGVNVWGVGLSDLQAQNERFRVGAINVGYDAGDLAAGRVDSVSVVGLEWTVLVRQGKLDLGLPVKPGGGEQVGGGGGVKEGPTDLGFRTLKLRAATVVLDLEGLPVRVQAEGEVVHDGEGKVRADLTLRVLGAPLRVRADYDLDLGDGRVRVDVGGEEGVGARPKGVLGEPGILTALLRPATLDLRVQASKSGDGGTLEVRGITGVSAFEGQVLGQVVKMKDISAVVSLQADLGTGKLALAAAGAVPLLELAGARVEGLDASAGWTGSWDGDRLEARLEQPLALSWQAVRLGATDRALALGPARLLARAPKPWFYKLGSETQAGPGAQARSTPSAGAGSKEASQAEGLAERPAEGNAQEKAGSEAEAEFGLELEAQLESLGLRGVLLEKLEAKGGIAGGLRGGRWTVALSPGARAQVAKLSGQAGDLPWVAGPLSLKPGGVGVELAVAGGEAGGVKGTWSLDFELPEGEAGGHRVQGLAGSVSLAGAWEEDAVRVGVPGPWVFSIAGVTGRLGEETYRLRPVRMELSQRADLAEYRFGEDAGWSVSLPLRWSGDGLSFGERSMGKLTGSLSAQARQGAGPDLRFQVVQELGLSDAELGSGPEDPEAQGLRLRVELVGDADAAAPAQRASVQAKVSWGVERVRKGDLRALGLAGEIASRASLKEGVATWTLEPGTAVNWQSIITGRGKSAVSLAAGGLLLSAQEGQRGSLDTQGDAGWKAGLSLESATPLQLAMGDLKLRLESLAVLAQGSQAKEGPTRVEGRLRARGGETAVAGALPVEVGGVEMDLPFSLESLGVEKPMGAFKVGRLKVGQRSLEPLAGEVGFHDKKLKLEAKWSLAPRIPVQVSAQADLNGAMPEADVRVRVPEFVLDDPDLVGQFAPAAGDVKIEGKLEFNADLSLRRGTITPSAKLFVEDLSVRSKTLNATVEGIAGAVNIDSLTPLRTPGNQRFKVASAQLGSLKFSDGFLGFRLEGDGQVLVERSRWKLGDGKVSVHSFRFDPKQPPVEIELFVEDFDLFKYLAESSGGKVSGEGKVYGRIPVAYANKNIRIYPGFLYGNPGVGRLRITDPAITDVIVGSLRRPDQPPESPSNKVADALAGALANFEYRDLSVNFTRSGKKLDCVFNFKGIGRHEGTEVDFLGVTIAIGEDLEVYINRFLFQALEPEASLKNTVDRTFQFED